jgi:hypothetical protein
MTSKHAQEPNARAIVLPFVEPIHISPTDLWKQIQTQLVWRYLDRKSPSFTSIRLILQMRLHQYDAEHKSLTIIRPELDLSVKETIKAQDTLCDKILDLCHEDDNLPTLESVNIATSNELLSIAEAADATNWRKFFFTGDELDRTPLDFAVERMIPEQGITGFGGLSGTAKTYIMMSIAKRLLTGGMLWGRFKTNQYKVLYLIPESASSPFYDRMKRMRIPTNTESFLVRTLSNSPTLPLSGEAMRAAVNGRVVFLDTLIRFMDGKVEQESTDMAKLGDLLLSLLRVGAVAVVFAHHAIKKQGDNELTLENAFRGSGDIGAILSAAHAVAQLDSDKSKTLIQVQCVKARDFDARLPFQLQGTPYINQTGDFKMTKLPGHTSSVRREKQVVRDETQEAEITNIVRLMEQKNSQRDIEEKLGISHNNPSYKEARKRLNSKKGETHENDED